MEQVTLREFFDKMGYGKYSSQINVSTFANECKVSKAMVSRLLKGKYEAKGTSEAFCRIKDFVRNNGYELVISKAQTDLESLLEYIDILEKENDRLKKLLDGQ